MWLSRYGKQCSLSSNVLHYKYSIGAVRKHMHREKHKDAVAATTKSKTICSFFNVKDTESVATAAELSFIIAPLFITTVICLQIVA